MFNAAICSQAAKTDEIVVAHLYTVGGRGGNEGWAVVGVSVGARAAITLCLSTVVSPHRGGGLERGSIQN